MRASMAFIRARTSAESCAAAHSGKIITAANAGVNLLILRTFLLSIVSYDARRRPAVTWDLQIGAAILLAGVAWAQSVPEAIRIYRDPQQRFQFSYPSGFGNPSPGTDDGFGDRVAAIRFSEFSAGVRYGRITAGGEAALGRGFPVLDLQSAGGLYDALTLQIFTPPLATVVRSALPPLNRSNFCDAVTRESHLDPRDPRLASLTPPQLESVAKVDRLYNVEPKVARCDVAGDTVTFAKESKVDPRGEPRHIYGAVRFLTAPYSTFQLIRGTADPPSEALLMQITAVVKSWQPGNSR
jgi:hypothetical protein